MTPPRPNEGIDVEETKAYKFLRQQGAASEWIIDEFRQLIVRLRTETEAAVTKRERDKIDGLVKALIKVAPSIGVHPKEWHNPNDPSDDYTERTPEMNEHNAAVTELFQRLVAYESNDAGESHE